MEEKDLPEYLRNALKHLGSGSATIDCDITNALYNANCVEDFKDNVSSAMNTLISEAECVKKMVAGEKGEESPVSGALTVDDARQIAFATLRYVATTPDLENFKDLVGRELDITDEVLDQAVDLLFSGKSDSSSLEESGTGKDVKIEDLQRLIDMYYVAEEEISTVLANLRNFGKVCDCACGDRVVFKQVVEGDFDYVLETCVVCGGNIER